MHNLVIYPHKTHWLQKRCSGNEGSSSENTADAALDETPRNKACHKHRNRDNSTEKHPRG